MRFIELSPIMADLLIRARYYEMGRIRHAEEKWDSQRKRDEKHRDTFMTKAIEAGVPEDQVDRFVFRDTND